MGAAQRPQLRGVGRWHTQGTGLHALIGIDVSQSLYRQRGVYLDFFTGLAPELVNNSGATTSAGFLARVVTYETVCVVFANSTTCPLVLGGNGANIPLSVGALTTPWVHLHADVSRPNATTLAIAASAWDSSRLYGTWSGIVLDTTALANSTRTLALGTGGASALFRNLVVRVDESLALPPPPPPTTTMPLLTPAALPPPPPPLDAVADFELPLLLAGAVALTLSIVVFAHAMVLVHRLRAGVVAASPSPPDPSRTRANSRSRRSVSATATSR